MNPDPTVPVASPGVEAENESIVIDQALFGYAHGHQLIESTTAFDDDSRLRLDRLTDGTGAETLAGFDGYLAGFPLPDGRYVFTRTWRAKEAKRPGSVWTHAVIISRDGLAKITDPAPVVSLLRKRPLVTRHPSLQAFRVSLDAVPLQTSELPDWSALVTALTASNSTTVGVTCRKASDGEAAVCALWTWLWPAVRNRFAFSLGATNRLSLEKGRYFDLLVVPEPLEVGGDGIELDPKAANPAGAAIWSEVSAPHRSELSQYVRFCGAETSTRTAAGVLANVWSVATNERLDRDARQLALAEAVVESFPEPTAMRRLKRSVFTANGRLPVDWDPVTTLEILSAPSVAPSVLADDVELHELAEKAIGKPSVLVDAFESLGSSASLLAAKSPPAKARTVLTQLPAVVESAIARSAAPSWMGALVAASPTLTASVLRDAEPDSRRAWAYEFWDLSAENQDRVSSAYVATGRVSRNQPEGAPMATAGWIAAFAPTTTGGLNWLVTCHPTDKARQGAVIDLAVALEADGLVARNWTGSIHDRALAQSGVRAARTERASATVATTLLLLIDPAIGVANDGRLKSWSKVLGTHIGGVGGAHLLRYAQRGEPPTGIEFDLLAFAFVEAWNSLANREYETWDALGDFPADAELGREWDRAYRLSIGLASLVRSWRVTEPRFAVQGLLKVVNSFDSRAAQQLDDILSNRIPAPQVTAAREDEQSRRRPLEPLRKVADEIRSLLGF